MAKEEVLPVQKQLQVFSRLLSQYPGANISICCERGLEKFYFIMGDLAFQ